MEQSLERALHSTKGLIYVGIDDKAHIKRPTNDWEVEPKGKFLKKIYDSER